jgi:hypothetical protein
VDILLTLLVLFALLFVVNRFGPKPKITSDNVSNKIIVPKKECPPHQWFWQEVVDQDGKKYGERIVCKVCGPLNFDGDSK